ADAEFPGCERCTERDTAQPERYHPPYPLHHRRLKPAQEHNMQNSGSLPFTPPSLPSGGGAITGLKSNVSAAGPDGAVTLSIPLPVSAGRGYAPSLSLSYHSRAGNGPFGMGWGVNLPAIRRRTNKGAPAYDDSDEFTGPDGEVLVPA